MSEEEKKDIATENTPEQTQPEEKQPKVEETKTESTENTEKKPEESTETSQDASSEKKTVEQTEDKPAEGKENTEEETETTEDSTTKTKIYPDVVPGATIRVHEKIKEQKAKGEIKERIQIFEGIILARKHGSESGATITVRKIAKGGFAVEKIYPLNSPIIDKIEVVKQAQVRQSKLGFLRNYKKKLRIKK